MTEEDMNRYLSVCKERDILQAKLAEWAELHSRHASMVIPGETDSADSYRRIWFEMKAKLECAERYKADADRSLALMALALEAKKSPDTTASGIGFDNRFVELPICWWLRPESEISKYVFDMAKTIRASTEKESARE